MDIEIRSHEAKTKLAALLRGVRAGNRYTITLRGKAIATLGPVTGDKAAAADAVDRMLAFIDAAPHIAIADVKALKNEGRA